MTLQHTSLKETLVYLESLPAYQKLRDEIKADVEISSGDCASTYCVFGERKIVLTPNEFNNKVGEIYPKAIEAILFEMNNLAQVEKFYDLIKNVSQWTPDDFVRNYEKIEYQSALKTKEILRQTFPEKIWKTIPVAYTHKCFWPHYLLQQLEGHSRRIWEKFSDRFPAGSAYLGNWKSPVIDSEEEKNYLRLLIRAKAFSEDSNPSTRNQGELEYELLKDYIIQQKQNGNEFFSRLASRIRELRELESLIIE